MRERGHAKIKFAVGDDPSHIWFLDELILDIQARIEEIAE